MTCLEKMTIDNPSLVSADLQGGAYGCPHHYGYAERPVYCSGFGIVDEDVSEYRCTECWNRDIQEIDTTKIHNFLFKEFHIPKDILDKAAESVAEYQEFLKMNRRSYKI